MDRKKLSGYQARFKELEGLLADNSVVADQLRYQKLAKEYSDLSSVVAAFESYLQTERQMLDLRPMLEDRSDKEMARLAEKESESLREELQRLEAGIDGLISPRRRETDRDLIFEIRAGTGGQEAGLFAGDLYRMYTRYAERRGWRVEPIDSHESESGGYKEVIFSVSGKGAEQRLRWESGGHRVQRVPATEASGRIHTSAATVAVLFEPEEVEIEIKPEDLRIDIFRSSGPGGQSVNTTDSAVRITHLSSGIVVSCQDERSQLKNRLKAMRVLRARLMDARARERQEKASLDRKLKVGSGDRSEKIRTYNYPDRRVTDHRIGFTTYRLPAVLDGDLDEITDALIAAAREEALDDSA
jgi:peptide chain release factor 1